MVKMYKHLKGRRYFKQLKYRDEQPRWEKKVQMKAQERSAATIIRTNGSHPCLVFCIIGWGIFSYIGIILVFSFALHDSRPYVSLFTDVVERRPSAKFLRQPRKFLEQICNATQCLTGKQVNRTLVTIIKSKATYGKRRELLRRSWNSISYLNGWRFEAIYLLGRSEDNATRALLDEEESRYNDLLQYDGPDDYVNMPYKVLAGMEWASLHLLPGHFYASADDDFLVDLWSFSNRFDEVTSNLTASTNITVAQNVTSNATTSFKVSSPIMCLFTKGKNEPVSRRHDSKWYVSRSVYPDEVYPQYCHGGMYVMPKSVAQLLLETSRTAPLLRLDDVWITGILRRRAGFPDNLVADMRNVAIHFGPPGDDFFDVMSNAWRQMYNNLTTLDVYNQTCKCLL